jgi:hypothetical protein
MPTCTFRHNRFARVVCSTLPSNSFCRALTLNPPGQATEMEVRRALVAFGQLLAKHDAELVFSVLERSASGHFHAHGVTTCCDDALVQRCWQEAWPGRVLSARAAYLDFFTSQHGWVSYCVKSASPKELPFRLVATPEVARALEQADLIGPRTCATCGASLIHQRSDAVYCGRACKEAAAQTRRRASRRVAGTTVAPGLIRVRSRGFLINATRFTIAPASPIATPIVVGSIRVEAVATRIDQHRPPISRPYPKPPFYPRE